MTAAHVQNKLRTSKMSQHRAELFLLVKYDLQLKSNELNLGSVRIKQLYWLLSFEGKNFIAQDELKCPSIARMQKKCGKKAW